MNHSALTEGQQRQAYCSHRVCANKQCQGWSIGAFFFIVDPSLIWEQQLISQI